MSNQQVGLTEPGSVELAPTLSCRGKNISKQEMEGKKNRK
jgi:hypothetical protein